MHILFNFPCIPDNMLLTRAMSYNPILFYSDMYLVTTRRTLPTM